MRTNRAHEELNRANVGERLESYRAWCRLFVRKSIHGSVGKRLDESDIIQSTWLDVVRKLEQFNGSTEAEFFAWLKTILVNNVKNAIRENTAVKRDVRREQDAEFDFDSASLRWWESGSSGSLPINRMIQGESALQLATAIEALPESQRQAIQLKHLQGLKLSEVSHEMGKSPDAVVSLIRRGMTRLAEILKDD